MRPDALDARAYPQSPEEARGARKNNVNARGTNGPANVTGRMTGSGDTTSEVTIADIREDMTEIACRTVKGSRQTRRL